MFPAHNKHIEKQGRRIIRKLNLQQNERYEKGRYIPFCTCVKYYIYYFFPSKLEIYKYHI